MADRHPGSAQEPARRTDYWRGGLMAILGVVVLLEIAGLATVDYQTRKLDRHLAELRKAQAGYYEALNRLRDEHRAHGQALEQTLGDMRREQQAYAKALGQAVGELRLEQHAILAQIEAGLRDLDASSASLKNNVDAIASQLSVNHSPTDIHISSLDDYDDLDQNWKSFRDTTDRAKVTCAEDKNAVVIVTLGQSNAANYGMATYTPKHDVVNFDLYDGECYRARDPLLGASGTGGNFATELADLLIERALFHRVIVAPIAMGGSTVAQWADEGRFNRRILVLIRRLFDADLKPTYILWHQGEGDPGEGDSHGRQYRKRLTEVVSTFRQYGIGAPFFVALATKCGAYPRPGGDNIREGQRSAVNPLLNVFLGPDTDQLGDEYRDAEHCHFNAAGLHQHAELWADVLESWVASNSGKE